MRRSDRRLALGAVLLVSLPVWGCTASGAERLGTVVHPPDALRAQAVRDVPGGRQPLAPAHAEISAQYTYWIEMTSLTVEGGAAGVPHGQNMPLPGPPTRIYIPFFAIDNGKYAVRMRVWERGSGNRPLSFPDKAYSDRDLTMEDKPIDLVHGFATADPKGPGNEADSFGHSIYGQSSNSGPFRAEFTITREPNRFATQTDADLALFDRQLIDAYLRDPEEARGPLSCLAALGKRAAAALVDMVLIVDRLFATPRKMTTPNYIARISDPSSRFYSDYLEYAQGRLLEAELVERLPHVAMIGDSLTLPFYISSVPGMFWRARTEHQKNWFLDTDDSPGSIHSVYERIDVLTPLVAVNYASAGAYVDSGKTGRAFVQQVAKTDTFSGQVRNILHEARFPDLLLIWLGHNNLNWVNGLDAEERKNPEKHLLKRLWEFRRNYAYQLERLVERARGAGRKTVIVVYGLGNWEAFFQAQRTAEEQKAKDPSLYPYLGRTYEFYESMRPEYRSNVARLGLMVNNELRDVVQDLRQRLRDHPNVRLEYSDALAKADVSPVELYHAMDVWHPSVEGHKRLAEIVFASLRDHLTFLGIRPR